MINEEVMARFISMIVEPRKVLETGLDAIALKMLRTKCSVQSFDIDTSRFTFVPTGFRSNALIRIPYDGNAFNGSVLNKAFDKFGDRDYFFREVLRVTNGPIMMIEGSLESFPKMMLAESDDIMVYMVSVNGQATDINMPASELMAKRDLKKMMTKPGGALNKFNTFVPEDVKTELTILCQHL